MTVLGILALTALVEILLAVLHGLDPARFTYHNDKDMMR